MPRRLRLLSLACFWVAVSLGSPAARAATESVESFAMKLGDTVIETVRNPALSEEQKQDILRRKFFESVDVDWIGRFALGRHWREASPAQQQQFLGYYRTFLVNYYTAKFTKYNGESFRVLNKHQEPGGEYLLSMEILRPREANVLIDYKVRENGEGYKIFDIIIEGVSLITTQRSEFNSVVSRKGLDYLIDRLAKKTAP